MRFVRLTTSVLLLSTAVVAGCVGASILQGATLEIGGRLTDFSMSLWFVAGPAALAAAVAALWIGMNGLSRLVVTYDRALYWFSNAMGAASFGAMCVFMSWMEAIPPNSLLLGVPFWLFLSSIAFLVIAGEIDDCKTEVDINRRRTSHSIRWFG